MDRNKIFKKIILITKDISTPFKNVSINDVLAMNEGYYEERYMLAKIDGDYQIIWNYEYDILSEGNKTLERYLRENAISFTKEYGIESYNFYNDLFPHTTMKHTGKNLFIIPLSNGEEIKIHENIKDNKATYGTQSEYFDLEGNVKTFNHNFSSTKALFNYLEKVSNK